LKKLMDAISTAVKPDPEASTASAPPALMGVTASAEFVVRAAHEGGRTTGICACSMVPLSTCTQQLLNVTCLTVKFERAGLFADTAPPPPRAEFGETSDENVDARQLKNFELKIRTVMLKPVLFEALESAKFGTNCGD
jgi:hypothetical protein